jgi:Na+-translocating ferredoxin:NAD+ oxidoreductase RnfD subunit
MKQWLLPINILIFFLSFLALGACFSWSGSDLSSWFIHVRNFTLLVATGFVVRFLLRTLIDPTIFFRREHRLITVLILFLLFDPTSPWWVFPLVRLVTELAQYFLRTPGGPVFNPAAFGTILVSFFDILPSWWGVNQPPRFLLAGEEISIFAFFTLFGAGYVAYRYRKLPLCITAFLSFLIFYPLIVGESPLYIAFEGTLLFFLLVMAPEPKTSPVPTKDQIVYGLIVGLLIPLGLFLNFTESFLTALLLGNLYTHRKFLLGLLRLTNEPKQGTVAI